MSTFNGTNLDQRFEHCKRRSRHIPAESTGCGMARKLRVEYPGAIYHLMDRGDRREPIFRDEEDRERFLATFGEGCSKTSWQVHEYCLMPNPFHVAVEAPLGKETGGSISRLNEQFKYVYDYARNLSFRANNALVQTFNANNLNQLTTVTRNSANAQTVAGTTTTNATSVTVNSQSATRYADATFAKDGFSLTDGNNTFTAIAQDSLGRSDTNAVTINLPASVTLQYDANGNLTNDVRRKFTYDDENQLSSIVVTNV